MQLPSLDVLMSFPEPNYIDPVLRGPANLIVVAILFPLVILVVGIRIYTRLCLSKSFGVDDWFIIAALFPTTAFAILGLLAEYKWHWDRHIWDVHLNTLITGLKVVITTEILFCLGTSLTKISMLTLTYRLISHSSTILSRCILVAIALVSTQGIAFCFAVLFQCRSPSNYWTLTFEKQPECMSETNLLLAAGIVNTITDAVAVALPIPTVWRVKLPVQQQVVLVCLFAIGGVITAVGATRTYYLYRVTTGWDKTWEAYPVWLTSSVELYVGIICASIPATKRFFGRYCSHWLGSTSSSPTRNSSPFPPTLTNNTTTSPRSVYMHEEHDIEFALRDYKGRKGSQGYAVERMKSFESDLERADTPCDSYGCEEIGVAIGSGDSRDDLVLRASEERHFNNA